MFKESASIGDILPMLIPKKLPINRHIPSSGLTSLNVTTSLVFALACLAVL